MDENKILEAFFSTTYKAFWSKCGYLSNGDKYLINEFVYDVVKIPLRKYIQYINSNKSDIKIESGDVFQYSKFSDTNLNFCKTLFLAGNEGYTIEKVGEFLLRNTNSANTKGANIKYGENHAKVAEQFGLCKKNDRCYFLSELGLAFPDFSPQVQDKLLIRLALRTRLIRAIIYDALRNDIYIEDYMSCLSKSTVNRRKSNVKTIMKLLKDNDEYNIDFIFLAIHSKEGFL